MPIQILMPALSPTMEEGKLAKWTVAEGDQVSAGDVIAEIETDKATMEVEAVDEGVMGKILIAEGAEGVKVNTPIAVLLEDGESAADISSGAAAAPVNGPAEAPVAAEPAPVAAAPAPAAPSANGARVFASPLARRLAAEAGLDLGKVTGSGPHGRIVKADVETAKAGGGAAAAPAAAPSAAIGGVPAVSPQPSAPSAPDISQIKAMFDGRNYEEVTLDGMRKTIAQRLTEAKQTIPHFYLTREVGLDALLELRKQMNAKGEARGVKLSVNDYIIKACALALQEIPDANAAFAGDRLLKFKASDVAVAVAIEGGLFTPVIRDAEAKALAQISSEMKDLAERARKRRLAPHEYQGGSFAISNLGMFGVREFSAVINPPQGSILAVGAGQQRVVVKDGAPAVATQMSLTLSVDHRVMDGALGAQFLAAICGYLEDPMGMLM